MANERGSALRRLLGLVLLVVVVVVVVLIVAGSRSTSKPARNDVTLNACTPGAGGASPTASGEVLNHTSKKSNYVIRVTFKDSGSNQVSEGADSVSGVAPLQRSPWQVSGVRRAQGPVKCTVSGVSRVVAPLG